MQPFPQITISALLCFVTKSLSGLLSKDKEIYDSPYHFSTLIS